MRPQSRPPVSTPGRTSPGLTPRADRRRAEKDRLIRRSALIGGPVLASAVVAAVALIGLVGPGAAAAPARASLSDSAAVLVTWNDSSGPSASAVASPAPSAARRTGGPATHRPARAAGQDLGTVSGEVTLMGPRTAPAGSKVAFLLTGPARVVKYATKAPYSVTIDTTTMPNGAYRLVVAIIGTHRGPLARFRLTVANNPVTPVPTTTTIAPTNTATVPPVPTTTAPTTVPTTTTTAPTTVPTTTTTTTTTTPTPPPTTTTTTTKPPTTTTTTTKPPTTTTTTTKPPVTTTTTAATSAPSSQVADVLSQTNAQRAAAGCTVPLTIDSRLASAAQAHTTDMAVNNYFAHNSQDGRSPFDRMTAAGYRFSTAGENIAMGYRTATDVMTGWMNSSGHRANILNCQFTNIGIGYAVSSGGSAYWTQDFGRPAA